MAKVHNEEIAMKHTPIGLDRKVVGMTNSDELRKQIRQSMFPLMKGRKNLTANHRMFDKATEDILEAVQAHQNQLIDRLIEGLPEKQLAIDQPNLYRGDGVSHQYLLGKNATIDQIKQLLIKEREKL